MAEEAKVDLAWYKELLTWSKEEPALVDMCEAIAWALESIAVALWLAILAIASIVKDEKWPNLDDFIL